MNPLRWTKALLPATLAMLLLAPLAYADCDVDPDCDPELDVCCNDDCEWEPEDAVCFVTPCKTNECTASHTCDSLNNDKNVAQGETCIDRNIDPCKLGECNGNQVCVNIVEDRCTDEEPCTDNEELCDTDPLQNGKFIKCLEPGDSGYSASFLPDDDPCSTSGNNGCVNETCQTGVCGPDPNDPYVASGTGCSAVLSDGTCELQKCDGAGECADDPNAPAPVQCAFNPCREPGCVLNGTVAECDLLGDPLDAGTVCDDDPWDCTHQRCGKNANCKNHAATTLKVCDPEDPADTTHCLVSTCARHQKCRTGAPYETFVGSNKSSLVVEGPLTTGKANQHFVTVDTCPNVALCNIDVCTGGADTCEDSGTCEPGIEGEPCPLPDCETTCVADPNSPSCTCE